MLVQERERDDWRLGSRISVCVFEGGKSLSVVPVNSAEEEGAELPVSVQILLDLALFLVEFVRTKQMEHILNYHKYF